MNSKMMINEKALYNKKVKIRIIKYFYLLKCRNNAS